MRAMVYAAIDPNAIRMIRLPTVTMTLLTKPRGMLPVGEPAHASTKEDTLGGLGTATAGERKASVLPLNATFRRKKNGIMRTIAMRMTAISSVKVRRE